MVRAMIAIYVRVSTQEQKLHGYSVNEQIDRLTSFAHALGYDKPTIYNDAGYSGATLDRPALSVLINDVKARKIEKVLVYKLDRLSRSQKDTLMLIEDIFLKNGCDFVSISENFDTSTPLGRAMIGILAVFAQLEREQIKERMSMGREARAKQGKYAGSHLHPIGYDYINGELIVNDFEKIQVQKIFEDYLSGMTFRAIAKELNEQGLTHKYGKWTPRVVRTTLERKTYIGYVHYGGEWFKGHHEPIIDDDLFNNVQKIRQRNYKAHMEHHRRAGHATSYLGGMVYCKKCGQKYIKRRRGSGKYHYDYYCDMGRYPKDRTRGDCDGRTIRMEELDEIIFSEIRKLSFAPTSRKTPKKSHEVERKIKDLDKQLERLMNLYTVGEMPLNLIQKKVTEINEQKSKLLAIPEPTVSPEEAKEVVTSFDDILEHGSLDDVRAAVSTLIDKIEIDDENVYIYWAFE